MPLAPAFVALGFLLWQHMATIPVLPPIRVAIAASKPPLPSWRDGDAKRRILDFVQRVTTPGSPDFVPPAARIATFDNDGTLWVEQPLYTEGVFALDQVKAMAPQHPEWRYQQPFQAILAGDKAAMRHFSEPDLVKLLAVTHTGMTPEAFITTTQAWLAHATHPRFQRRYTDCVYQPMLELLDYLRACCFQTFMVTGGGIDFVRAFSDRTYGIPPEKTLGSSGKTRFEIRDGRAVLVKLPELGSINDQAGKAVNINLQIGRRPILAFGNSDGDLQMLQYAAGGKGPRLLLLLHHDDAVREYAYDRQSPIGRLDKAWDEAVKQGWTMVSMKDDFRSVFSER
jgi:phosphoserine phosphatase